MSDQQRTKRNLRMAISSSGALCTLVVLASTPVSGLTWQSVCAQVAAIILFFAAGAVGRMDEPRQPPSRKVLLPLMRSIKPFAIESPISLIGMFRSTSSKDAAELGKVEKLVLSVLDLSQVSPFREDYFATWHSYRSGDFHGALSHAPEEWLEAVLRVSRSRGDLHAAWILADHF